MPTPSMFLVHGPGLNVDITAIQAARTTVDQSGVAAREWEFAAPSAGGDPGDLKYWEYEKGDFSIRFDTEAGPLEQILLAAALRAGLDTMDRATSGAGLGGRSGAGLSGAGVSGAGLSGAGVSGAGLSGAGLRGR